MFQIKTMTRTELDVAVQWAATEGWNPGLHDADTFFDTDPNGFFMAFRNDEPIGSVSAVAYDTTFGFIGFFIVKPEYRGHRVGIDLGTHAMAYLGARNIGIDGVESKVKNYTTYGFQVAYHNFRFEGKATAGAVSDRRITPLRDIPFAQIAAYDRMCFPTARDRFLNSWLAMPDATALGLIQNGALNGYGMIRRCGRGYKFGPLFADDRTSAVVLYHALTATVEPGSPVFLDVPDANAQAMALAQELGLKPVFGTARMYNHGAPQVQLNKIFGVTSYELG